MFVALRVHAHGGDDVVRGHNDAVSIDGHQVDLGKAALHQFGQGLGAFLDKLTRYGALGDAQLIGTAVHHAGVFAGADVAHQDVGDAPGQIAVAGQRRIGRHRHFAIGATQPGTLYPQLGLSDGHHAALAAVPAYIAGVTPGVLGAGHRLGRQHK